MDPVVALAQLGGTATLTQLVSMTGRRRLRTAVARGQVVRTRRGSYALRGLSAEVALRCGGMLAGPSAAQHHELALKRPPRRPVVLVPRGAGSPAEDVDVRWGCLPEGREGVTGPLRSVVDCARWLPFDEALVVVDSALRSGFRAADLAAAASALPRTGRSRAAAVVAAGDPGAASALESLVRAHASAVPGLALETQVQIGWHRVDLADRRLRIVVECDSFGFHGGPADYARDVRRYTELVVQGWTVLRFSWQEAMDDPGWVVHALTEAAQAEVQRNPRRNRS